MRLNNKILVSNIILSVIIFLLTSVGMYFLVKNTVYTELDHHLLQHKTDITDQLDTGPSSFNAIQNMGGLGTYEWVEITKYDGSIPLHKNFFATLDTARNRDESPETYRRLTTTISVNNHNYLLKVYEEVASWNNISWTILITILGVLLIWILLVYLVNQAAFKKLLAPFYKTVDTLEHISDPTHLEKSFPDSTTHEINVLNHALNDMMKEIRSSFEDQKQFIQNASHELLTPLSIIRQKAEKILAKSDLLDRQTLESVNDIQQTAVRLSRLSNALLLISRIENKQFSLDEQIDISEISEEVIYELRDFISMKNITLKKEISEVIHVKGNRELIRSAIYNIVQNAIKFAPPGSTITIKAGCESDSCQISVQDQGPGIPLSLVDSIFDRFKKGNIQTVSSKEHDSPGLGLSIVKSICQLHEFDCSAKNLPKQGAKITIHF